MAVYHVYHNSDGKRIFAGTTNKKGDKWVNKTDVTQEAIEAVRDHFIAVRNEQKDDPEAVGYAWTLQDGKRIILKLTLEEPDSKGDEE